MTSPSQLVKALTWLLLLTSPAASALSPQTGIYWNPRQPGVAVYVEEQRGTLFAVIYAYSATDREPEFFVASGPILPEVEADFIPSIGLYPIEGFSAPLYRVPAGSCLACPYSPIAPAESIGAVAIMFPGRGGLYIRAEFTDGTVFPQIQGAGQLMVRFNFALGGVPTSTSAFPQYFADMRGEWVFTDQSDPQRVPWRFNFTIREDGLDLSDFPLMTSVGFRDPSRNAVMYCFSPDIEAQTPAERAATPNIGCELRQNGTAIFWSPNEIAIDEFYGTLGAMPPRSAGILRGSQRVVGRRISD